jgi:ATP-dependent exoDNAse (exonuclease V) beta subunit
VETVREWTSRPGGTDPGLLVDASAVAITRVGRIHSHDRPRGAGFGSLVHAVLAQAPFEGSRQAIASLAEIEARVLDLSGDEADAAAAVVEHVFAHEVVARARAAGARGACRRETPVTCLLPDGALVEGVVDLAFEHDGTWTVVDYKTDREIAALGEERYRRQVALYASAIAQATGAPCNGIVLVI